MDIADIDPVFASDSPLSQQEVNLGISQGDLDRQFALQTMNKMKPERVTLGSLEVLYRGQHEGRVARTAAVRKLQTAQKITVDDQYQYRNNDPDMMYTSSTSHVDALLIVPNNIGLGALLPVDRPDQSFSIQLCLTRLFRPFPAKDSCLGFDHTKALMCIGKFTRDQLWCGLAGEAPENVQLETAPTRGRLKDAIVNSTVAHILLMFFAYSLDVAGIADIHVPGERYPRNIDELDAVKDNTNLL